MKNEPFVTRENAAAYINSLGLKITKGTLQKMATVGGGPTYRRFGRHTVYLISDLDAWIALKLSAPIHSTTGKSK